MSIYNWIEEAAILALDGLDLSILFFEERSRAKIAGIRRAIDKSGLSLAIINTYSDLTHPNAAIRKTEIGRLEKDIGVAADLGAEHVRIVSGQAHPQTSSEQGIRWSIDGFTRAAAKARTAGIQLVYENHSKPGNWEFSDFSLDPDHFKRIASEVTDTGIKLLFDTANPIVFGIEPLPFLKDVVRDVVCVHAADTRVRGSLEPVAIGTGLVPFHDVFRLLKSIGYSDWISIEEASGAGKAGVQSAVAYVRETWDKS